MPVLLWARPSWLPPAMCVPSHDDGSAHFRTMWVVHTPAGTGHNGGRGRAHEFVTRARTLLFGHGSHGRCLFHSSAGTPQRGTGRASWISRRRAPPLGDTDERLEAAFLRHGCRVAAALGVTSRATFGAGTGQVPVTTGDGVAPSDASPGHDALSFGHGRRCHVLRRSRTTWEPPGERETGAVRSPHAPSRLLRLIPGIDSTCIRLAVTVARPPPMTLPARSSTWFTATPTYVSPSSDTRRFAFTFIEPMWAPTELKRWNTIVVA